MYTTSAEAHPRPVINELQLNTLAIANMQELGNTN